MYEHEDFGLNFQLSKVNTIPDSLKSLFIETLKKIDSDLITYYQNLNHNVEDYFLLSLDSKLIGYSKLVLDNNYYVLSEIFVLNEYRNLGLGTFMLDSIRDFVHSKNIKLRTITLPSDRISKNFYEANGITARILFMEEKRENTRYRS